MAETNSAVVSKRVLKKLRKNQELRIDDFTKERVALLNEKINENYEEGIGISGTKLSRILFNYIQPLYKYEGIAYHMFGLVATRPVGKQSPLFLVRISDAGRTEFPVCKSKYHNYNTVSSIKESVNEVWDNEDDMFSGIDWSDADYISPEEEISSSSETTIMLSKVLSSLSDVCSYLSDIVKHS